MSPWSRVWTEFRRKASKVGLFWIATVIPFLLSPLAPVIYSSKGIPDDYEFTTLSYIVLFGAPATVALVLCALSLRKVMRELGDEVSQPKISLDAPHREDPEEIELDLYSSDGIAFIPRVPARWAPDDQPQVGSFLRAVHHPEPRETYCGRCHKKLISEYRGSPGMQVEYYYCREGHLGKGTSEHKLYEHIRRLLNSYHDHVREEYEKVWENYCDIYTRHVGS